MVLFVCMMIIMGTGIFLGYKKGFVKILFSLIATILTVLLAICLTPMVSNAVKKSAVYDSIYNAIEEHLIAKEILSDVDLSALLKDVKLSDEDEAVSKAMQEYNISEKDLDINKLLKDIKLPKEVSQFIESNATVAVFKDLNVSSPTSYVAAQLANLAVNAIVFVILFVVIYILVNVAINAVDFASRLPVINTVNKTGGMIVGAVEGLLVIWVAFLFVAFLSGTPAADFVNEQVAENPITAFFYNNNLLLKYILSILPKK